MKGTDRGGPYEKVRRGGDPLWEPSEGGDENAPTSSNVEALASSESVVAPVFKALFVLSAPVSASLIGAAQNGQNLPNPELATALDSLGDWVLAIGIVVWALIACRWLIIHLFSSSHHHLSPLYETLEFPALVLYLAALAPWLPYTMLGPWGSGL